MTQQHKVYTGTVKLDAVELENLCQLLAAKAPVTDVIITAQSAAGIGIATTVEIAGETYNITNYDHW